jgi:hypothetical protein
VAALATIWARALALRSAARLCSAPATARELNAFRTAFDLAAATRFWLAAALRLRLKLALRFEFNGAARLAARPGLP